MRKRRSYSRSRQLQREQMEARGMVAAPPKITGLVFYYRAHIPVNCECCGSPCSRNSRLSLDHDHKTRMPRGFLCSQCNRAIGMLGDSLEGVEAAYTYMRRVSSLTHQKSLLAKLKSKPQ